MKLLLGTPVRFQSRRKATSEAQVAYSLARQEFTRRATPTTWARLVAASRKLHAIVDAERAEHDGPIPADGVRQLEGLEKDS